MKNKSPNNRTNSVPFNTRLENFLKKLVVEETGHLSLPAESFNERVEHLAQRLVKEGIIVLVGDLHPSLRSERDYHIQDWVNSYAQLYYVLNYVLFETTDEPSAYIADNKYPAIVVFKAKTIVVNRVLTGLVIPYIAKRQADGTASRAELRGMIELMLEELAATNLPFDRYTYIRDHSLILFDRLLKSPIRQVSLTHFSRQFLVDIDSKPTIMDDTPKPDSLPELPKQHVKTADLSRQPEPDKILRMPLPSDQPNESAIPRPSLLNRIQKSP